MRTRRVVVLAAIVVCLGVMALAQDQPPIPNWTAPPYWTPPALGQTEREPGEMQASALALPSSPLPFVAIAPCRIVDTRVALSDGFHQPAFANGETRTYNFPASTGCPGLPAAAGAYSVNVNYRPLSQASYLTAFPTGTTMPVVATVVGYSTTTFTGNAAIVPAGTGGEIDVYSQYAAHVVIDINGYYGPGSVVTSLNTKTGDVTLAPGTNVTITPSGNTLTIAAGGLTLPYSGSIASASTAFALGNTGSGYAMSLTSNSGWALTVGSSAGSAITAWAAGTYGLAATANGSGGIGVRGTGPADGTGVRGDGNPGVAGYGNGGWGVYGQGAPGAAGVYGLSDSNAGVYGTTTSGYAGYFNGPGYFSGLLTKPGGGFRIDHPLDPEHTYLQHSFVESPDMKNVYDGVVVTDENGLAVVQLPAWFDSLNRDFRYQLTVIGRFAQAIIEQEIEHNRFTIRTNLTNVKVSWQVTGIRKDPWANAHRLVVEEPKTGKEVGSYLHPDVYGQPEGKSVEWAIHPEMMQRAKEAQEKATTTP